MVHNQNLNEYKSAQRRETSKMVNRGPDRRADDERRTDLRQSQWQLRSIALWIKSVFKPRLGVDRRKGADRRIKPRLLEDSRYSKSLLTAEEIHHLIGK